MRRHGNLGFEQACEKQSDRLIVAAALALVLIWIKARLRRACYSDRLLETVGLPPVSLH